MKRRFSLSGFQAFSLAACLLAGCSTTIPTTKIRMGSYVGEFPKQFHADSMTISVNPSNGIFYFTATNITAENEPNVIAAQGQADAARIGAVMDGASKIATNAISAGVRAAMKLK